MVDTVLEREVTIKDDSEVVDVGGGGQSGVGDSGGEVFRPHFWCDILETDDEHV